MGCRGMDVLIQRQKLLDLFNHSAITPVVTNRQRQCPLQHALQGLSVPPNGQAQVACIEGELGGRRIKANRAWKKDCIGAGVARPRKGKFDLL